MIDYGAVMKRYSIEPKGVVHVGAYNGSEDKAYVNLGFRDRLFIEAQPDTFELLKQHLEGSGACYENFAISDRNGTADFHTASFAQSSSLLKLRRHLDVYPDIVSAGTINVRTIRLDDLLSFPQYSHRDYNFLNVDIQGAELLCLKGACVALTKFDLLNLEVNFDALYEDAAHISQLDAYLHAFDFIRADTIIAHPTWGDAIYVRNRYTKSTLSDLF